MYVTHDQQEALTMSDRVCLLHGGRIEQLSTPSELYFKPRTVFAADFLGDANLFDGRVVDKRGEEVVVRCEALRCRAAALKARRRPSGGSLLSQLSADPAEEVS